MTEPADKAPTPEDVLERAQGALLGQLAGDALGSQVEFLGPEEIKRIYPHGLRDLAGSRLWNTLAGQPTDDSEMALALARSLIEAGTYDPQKAREAYLEWLDSGPFDVGNTVLRGLLGDPNPESQANGALMRVSPIGIFGARRELDEVAGWARADARLTHPHRVCQEANALFAQAIAFAIRTGAGSLEVYEQAVGWARKMGVPEPLLDVLLEARRNPPRDYLRYQGWVLIAFQNAFWQLLYAPSLEDGLVDTVMRGGDTDTNAAIAGALLGAVYGRKAVPKRWTEVLLSCRPEAGRPGVVRPRPRPYWPVDALDLARGLLRVGGQSLA